MEPKFNALKSLPGPVLITGHTGFKGAWLSIMLRRLGIETVGLSLPAEEGSLASKLDSSIWSRQYIVDIRNKVELSSAVSDISPSFVFHLAAQALVLESYASPIETFETNVLGTANLLDAVRNISGIKGAVVATTDKVYKNDNLGRKFVESDALEGADPYSASKVGTEAVVKAWQTLTSEQLGFGITSVRAGNVVGGGDNAANRLLPDLVRGFSKNEQVVVRNPKSTRPWQHVSDPLNGYLMTAESIIKGNPPTALNFGPGEYSLSVEEVVAIARNSWDGPTSVEIAEPVHGAYEAKLLELDATKAGDALGWSPRYSQEESIRATISWWQNTNKGKMSVIEACEHDLERYEF